MPKCNIIAHRGSNKRAPQNTLPAFAKALEQKATGFETDVHLTKDGVPVICHNTTIDATSDGSGRIAAMTLEELKMRDFGLYFGREFINTKIPTLDEFLELAQDKGLKVLNIELKREPDDSRREQLVKKTLEAVTAHGLDDILLISSFSAKILKLIKEYRPECKTALLYPFGWINAYQALFPPIKQMKKLGCFAAHPHRVCVRGNFVKKAHDAGLEVNVWTVDEAKDIREMIKADVDGIITDCPDRVNYILTEMNDHMVD